MSKALKVISILPIALWVGYVVIGNVMLSTKLVARLVSYNPTDATLFYGSAWSLWPGVVHVKELRLSGSDSLLEWAVLLDEVEADIHLTDLFRKKFHAEDIRAEGFTFRMRLLVDPTSERDLEAPHIKALPPIPEFTNPPLKPELPPKHDLESSDEGYNLWTVHLERVDTTLKEVWIQQVRYAGGGRVRGGFYYKPLRSVRVGPVALELRSGEVHLADRVVARVDADLDVTMNTFDPRDIEGLDIFDTTWARVRLDAQLPGLDFIYFFTGEDGGPRIEDGSGGLRANLVVNRGNVEPGSSLSYGTSHLAASAGSLRAAVAADVDLRVDERGQARLAVAVPRATLERPGKGLPPIVVERASAAFDAPELHLMRLPPGFSSKVEVVAAAIPDLRWLNPDDAGPDAPRFTGGAAFVRSSLEVDPLGRGTGALSLLLKQGALAWKETRVKGDVKARLSLDAANLLGPTARLGKSRIEIEDLAIEHEGEALPGWWARIDVDDAKVGRGLMEAAIRLECKDARPAVALLDAEDAIPGWAAGLLTMEGLKASATVRRKESDVDFRLLEAQGGNLAIRGRLTKSDGQEPLGAFLVKSGLLSVGIDLERDGAGVHPLVGDDWVNEKMAALGR
ncbi:MULTISPECIES: hypothetical protein [Sorangium]|uniref:DUF748 domain-containing protein n=1 Tax=Sorangium cellulosum TaxID=56 RepID=A0A4P2QJN0_SORCE|nr:MULTISPECIES: hypothetical protein [Sorangium]AUX29643.1 hypothetical protein SOCE836_017340 [Sorangium cellulosum]WCQ89032.1 hypothetical protein NQZ70_01717 [Sorangium sp. Soce836]